MARALMTPLFERAAAVTLSATEPPAAGEMLTIPDTWKSGPAGPRVVGLAAIMSSGSGNLTGGKVWVKKTGFAGGLPVHIGDLDTLALSTAKGAFRRLFDVGGWESIGVSGTGSDVVLSLVPFEVVE